MPETAARPLDAARARLARPQRAPWSPKAALGASALAAVAALLLAAVVILGPGVVAEPSADATLFAR